MEAKRHDAAAERPHFPFFVSPSFSNAREAALDAKKPSDVCGFVHHRTNQLRRSILWIDDQLEMNDGWVRWLIREGFDVHCAPSAQLGLASLKQNSHDAIILDLHLPDMSGLQVLEEIREGNSRLPVLILTGYATIQSAIAAMKLGASDYLEKPFEGEQLISALRLIASRGHGRHYSAIASLIRLDERTGHISTPSEVAVTSFTAADLSVVLSRIADSYLAPTQKARVKDTLHISGELSLEAGRQTLISLIALAIVNDNLPMPLFLQCALALREAQLKTTNMSLAELSSRLRSILDRARDDYTSRRANSKVHTAISTLQLSLTQGILLTERELAQRLQIHPAYLGRLLRSHTGMGFRIWRLTLLAWVAARALANESEQIAQIAYRLGYAHPSQLDRHFRRVFAMSPRQFRRALSRF